MGFVTHSFLKHLKRCSDPTHETAQNFAQRVRCHRGYGYIGNCLPSFLAMFCIWKNTINL